MAVTLNPALRLLVIGCGRVGSRVARDFAADGWDVTVVDEKEEALSRLGSGWAGGFIVGHGMDSTILRRAGIEDADAVVVATNGDNTNLVIAQVVTKRYGIDAVVVRVLDPARAEFYAARGMQTVCPTQTAIAELEQRVRKATAALAAG
jgi:trk system potassium uptake protein